MDNINIEPIVDGYLTSVYTDTGDPSTYNRPVRFYSESLEEVFDHLEEIMTE